MAVSRYPLFNRRVVSWAELRLLIEHSGGSFSAADFQSIDWAHGVETTPVYGEGFAPIAHTVGQYKVGTAKFTMLKGGTRRLRQALAAVDKRYGLVVFGLHASWDDGDGVIHKLEWRGARIKDESGSASVGMDPLKEDVDCSVLRIFEDGVCPAGDS